MASNLAPMHPHIASTCHIALALYRDRKFSDAAPAFAALAAKHGDAALYAMYAQRSASLINQSPPVNWDGATTFETK